MIDSLLMQKAFKKLKSNAYYDKTNLPLRDKIVSFECNYGDELDDYLSEIFQAFSDGGDKWEKLSAKIISSVGCSILPKSLKKEDSSPEVISNFHPAKEIIVEKHQSFIDLNVEGHLMGMIWLFMVGWKLDKELHCCYGNRIRAKLRNQFSEEITFSPYLFEPYFEKYESWRDTALQLAETQLSKNEDVLVLTLDFERFYYSVDITDDFMKNILINACDRQSFDQDVLISRINNLIFEIITAYSKQYYKFFPQEEYKNILPIGFLPSNVIANWCLKPFDDALTNGWNPLYYGRYVDDILIVEKIEKNSALYKKASEENLTVDDIISYYLVKESRWKGFENSLKGKALFRRKKLSGNKSIEYSILPDITQKLGKKTKIKVQDTKAKVFYFKSGQSDALISCFRDNISKNKSEFRRMPEDDSVFLNDDYSEIYELNQKGINKFREVDGISLDKYGLSKYLGKYQRVCGLINDKHESKFVKDIQKIFTPKVIIENYTLWEKVLSILYINNYYEAFSMFLKMVTDAIYSIKGEDSEITFSMQNDLISFLMSGIYRVFSLCPGKDNTLVFENLKNYEPLLDYSLFVNVEELKQDCEQKAYMYFMTRMTDKSMCVLWPDLIIHTHEINQNKMFALNCTSLSDVINYLKDIQLDENILPYTEYKYYPYLITMYDLSIAYQYCSMIKGTSPWNQKEIIDALNELYIWKNYNCKNPIASPIPIEAALFDNNYNQVIKVGDENREKIRIAVSSIKLDETNFTNIIKGRPNRKYRRYQQISHLVNTSIQQKADILIMPEACVPIEWLATIARTCAKNNMAAITGVEHVVINKRVYNMTAVILPFVNDDYQCAHIIFHHKNHFAPDELRQIEGYRLTAMDSTGIGREVQYELFDWNNFWFSVYCCYELASITDRSIFQSYVDAVFAVEWNHDVNYYSNILESLSRDLHCYCVQVNSCDYGDSRVTKPSKTESKDILRTKGGEEATVLVGSIDIGALRDYQIKEYELQRDDYRFKPTPPQFDKEVVLKKIQRKLFEKFN